MTEFKDHFINQTLPSFEKIDELLAKYPCLKDRRRDSIKSWIHSQFKKKNVKTLNNDKSIKVVKNRKIKHKVTMLRKKIEVTI